jgi:hypothetical protein
MGGDCSQKLRPWRGADSSPGRSKPPAQSKINTLSENLARGFTLLAFLFPDEGGAVLKVASCFSLKPVSQRVYPYAAVWFSGSFSSGARSP